MNIRATRVVAALALALGTAIGFASAQSKVTGALTGTVTSGDEGVIPGATVAIESPQMIGGARSATTGPDGRFRFAEIPPGTWHTLAVLGADAVLYELIDGHYDAATHKRFAPWAPPESDFPRGQAWLESLIHRCGLDTGF